MNDDIEKIFTDIVNAVHGRRYYELNPIMRNIFLRDDRIESLVELANSLGATAIEDLLLCGLTYLLTLTSEEYERMFEWANKRDIAFYNLTRFMMFHGRARRQMFGSLGADMAKLDSVGDVKRFVFQRRK